MNESQKNMVPILIALIVAIFPHIARLPLWITLWCVVMWGYLLLSFKFKFPLPGKNIQLGLAGIGIVGLVMTYSTTLGQNAYLGLLAVMAALKPFEINSHRDRMVTVFLAYFIVITSLFLSETLAITLYMLLSVWITTAVLIRINDPFGRFKINIKLSALIMAQAIPLMILLFFLFPRIQGSLFGLSLAGIGKSGFSDNLAPGSVANLVENNEVAFRAMFEKKIPLPDLLYWRGIVFSSFDGRKWFADKHVLENNALPQGKNPVSYTVMLEPHNNRWLFALDMPAKIPPPAKLLADYTLRARRPVKRKLRYEMTSNTSYQAKDANLQVLAQLTRLPAGVNPKTRNLAKRITETARNEDEKVNRILDYFKTGGFSYTLQPPRLGKNSVDAFIFNSKKGYCEHYASAFAFMLRSLEIPARIVGGYQGGEVNPYADYLIVRQSDAHVWVEVWFQKKGWTRVDPTAVVAPDRISEGVRGSLSPADLPDFLSRRSSGFIDQIRFGWDAISTRWSAWFEGYSYYEQKALLKKLGIASGAWDASIKALLLLLVSIGMIVIIYAWFSLKSPQQKPDAVKKYYLQFCQKLSRAGFEKQANQGPVDYAKYISKNRPDLKNRVTDITYLYVQLRFRRQFSKDVLAEFIQKVRVFTPVLK
jgi:transglutaminase-like putative cysteine protease